MLMTANFLQLKVSSNGMVNIHRRKSSIFLRPTEIQGLIQDLFYARKAVSKTSEPSIIDEMAYNTEIIYLKALIQIIVKFMCK